VLHLRRAFHGRTGYTLSLTNTEPTKTARFPKFDWPRIDVPAIRFPLESHRDELVAAEERALEQARAAFERHPHDIACFIAEPIQGEGGDNHLRAEFLRAMQDLCHEHDALFVLDEVQTGMGVTGMPWCYQHLNLEPDLVVFGKKTQVCGIMGGGRIDEVQHNVFTVSGRISSTWSGSLVDMVRTTRILEIIEDEELMSHVARVGKQFLDELGGLGEAHPDLVDNVRGLGLLAAFDLPDATTRDRIVERLRSEEQVLTVPCGERSLRFRPHLAVTEDELTEAVEACGRVLAALAAGR
jgi:L-lysine 6-transaminase